MINKTSSLNPAITKQLHERGFRVTPQRLAILKILQDAGGHLLPVEVYRRAQEVLPGVTEATVYRTLSFLAEEKLALVAHVGGGQLVYEGTCDAHHHLICRRCGGEVEVADELLQGVFNRLQQDTGFLLDSTHVTFFGLCPVCRLSNPDDIALDSQGNV